MKQYKILLVIPAILLLIIVIYGISQRDKDFTLVYPTTEKIDYFNNANLDVKPIQSKLTREQVAQTAKSKPCLVIYDNKVYQLPSEFFSLHPGGSDELVQGCGTDITFSFNTMPHTSTAEELLSSFYYAELME